VARFVQGFSGGWAMVIGRAVIVDLATGARLVRVLNVIAGVGGIAPIVGPLLGAVILQLSHWRVSFWMVAGLGLVMIVSVLVAAPESLPGERRHGGGLRSFAVAGRQVLSDTGATSATCWSVDRPWEPCSPTSRRPRSCSRG
jgi:MFS transporter, DHA1 family, multidrug resistance protein